jgi:4-methylaminobutanoate oxidase (formaldehyde-forming)
MTAREIDLDYARVLAMRVTYVGELGWELHVPADMALTVYDALMGAGGDLGYRNVGMAALSSLRIEKAYRDMGVDIDVTDTPLDVGLGFAVAWDKPGGFIGRDALLAQKAEAGPPKRRYIQFLVEDPEPLLYHAEPQLRDGRWIGYNRAGAYGHTLGGAVGLAVVEDEAGIPASDIAAWHLEVEIAGRRYPVKASLRPMYDPDRVRVKA